MNRRDLLRAGSVGLVAGRLALGDDAAPAPAPAPRSALGIVEHCYSQRHAHGRANGGKGLLDDPAAFVDFCSDRGAAGIQMSLTDKTIADQSSDRFTRALSQKHAFFEASCELPRNRIQLETFVAILDVYRSVRATVVRTVAMPGRRYERFHEPSAFRAAAEHAYQSLLLVKKALERPPYNEMRVAVENHKDWRTSELVDLLERVDSPNIGVCLDTGNSIALLEDPMETVEALAPWAVTTHLKDMAVEQYEDGFLLSEVPLGKGFLDLPRIVSTIRKQQPGIHFNLEMITRDPLKVPCLTEGYWATLDGTSGWPLARALKMVHRHASKTPLPRVSGLDPDERVRREDDNVRESLRYARERLGLTA